MAFKWSGDNVEATLRKRAKAHLPKVVAAVRHEFEIEGAEAQRRTPVWNPARPVPPGHAPGTLRASKAVDVRVENGNTVIGEISFGGLAEDYAFIVHEDTEAHHATGQDHFLSSVLKESQRFIGGRIAARIKEKG